MQSFTFCSPTEIVFGRGAERRVAEEVRKFGGTRVLIVYGGGSVVENGVLGRIETQLESEGLKFEKFGGVVPNPRGRRWKRHRHCQGNCPWSCKSPNGHMGLLVWKCCGGEEHTSGSCPHHTRSGK